MKYCKKLCQTVGKISEKLALITTVLPFLLMCLVVYEVFMRYVLKSPTVWSMEMNQFLFCAIIALGAAYTLKTDGHVSVDILYNRMRPRVKAVFDIIGTVIVLAVLCIAFWKTGESAVDALRRHETTGSMWNPVTWPIKMVIPVSIIFFLLQGVAKLLESVIHLITGEMPQEEMLPGVKEDDNL